MHPTVEQWVLAFAKLALEGVVMIGLMVVMAELRLWWRKRRRR